MLLTKIYGSIFLTFGAEMNVVVLLRFIQIVLKFSIRCHTLLIIHLLLCRAMSEAVVACRSLNYCQSHPRGYQEIQLRRRPLGVALL